MPQHGLADEVAIELAAFAGLRRREGGAIPTMDQTFQQGAVPAAGCPVARTFLQDRMHFASSPARQFY